MAAQPWSRHHVLGVPGRHVPVEHGGGTCSDCPAGKYAGSNGASRCLACAKGTFSARAIRVHGLLGWLHRRFHWRRRVHRLSWNTTPPAPATASAQTAPTDRLLRRGRLDAGSAVRAAMPWCGASTTAMQASTPRRASSCVSCPTGKYSAKASASCTLCAAGTFNDDTAQTKCSDCTAGKFSARGSATCTACPAGKKSGAKATSCSNCPQGSITASEGLSSCNECPVNTYASGTGNSVCIACDTGKTSVVGSVPVAAVPLVDTPTELASATSVTLASSLPREQRPAPPAPRVSTPR